MMRKPFLPLLFAFCALILLPALAFPANEDSIEANFDSLIEDAVESNTIPGAVLWVGQPDRMLYAKAYGSRSLVPRKTSMKMDTIFDAASLTKVLATTTAVMQLWEQGKIRLGDRVTEYLPKFQGGKSDITVRDLLTHYSGLRPDVDLVPRWSGESTGINLALTDKPATPPGRRFVYSDINFILLAEIVRAVSGKRIDEYARENIFEPLGMKDTGYLPPASKRSRIAPTEIVDGTPLLGVVHDPTTRYMGGVAGHAGVFTTAADLARFARMILNHGELDGRRVLSEGAVSKMSVPASPASRPDLRGLGWDIDSRFSSNRGELFPVGSFGHTGFTGTSLWIDPHSNTFVILLTNSVHIPGKSVVSLRAKVATLAAELVGISGERVAITSYGETIFGPGNRQVVNRDATVENGIDVLAADGFRALQGKRVGLITNHTGLLRDGRRNIDAMRESGVTITAIFSPEHGITGALDHENIADAKDERTGIPIFSLYRGGDERRPSAAMLDMVDVIVFDIQDVGARFYTYMSTMGYAMEEADKRGMPFYVLDRPNPITGVYVEGPPIDAGLLSFIGYHPMPLRHGMTLGELARMFHAEKQMKMPLEVVAMRGWQRGDWFDSIGQTWVNPSPNMRNLTQALLYTGVAMLEGSLNYSVGRGTDSPFEMIGANWINGQALSEYLNKRDIPGVRFYPVSFTPSESKLKGVRAEGVRILVTDREEVRATHLGVEIAAALVALYPDKVELAKNRNLIGNQATIDALAAGTDPRRIVTGWEPALAEFVARRSKYLIYKE
ncbi:MAG: DUF1343 domain-containing protein [Bryobacterales bacterium]|nr:DUF1343 domain-containing protein [Bryobacterales bacterium]